MGQELGLVTNDDYRAAKLAQDAQQAKDIEWYRAVQGTKDSPFYGSIGSQVDGQDVGWYYDLQGQMNKGFLPEYSAYDPQYEVIRQSTTNPNNTIPWDGSNDFLRGTMLEGSTVNRDPNDPNGYEVVPGTGVNWGEWDQSGGGNLSLGGGPFSPTSPPTSGPGPTYGAPPDFNTPAVTQPGLPPNRGTTPVQPYYPPTQGGTPGPPTWGGGRLEMGNGGVTGIAKEPAIDWSALQSLIKPPMHGYESSTNKDFYQRQFQQQEGQQNAQKLRELAAATRAQQSANAPAPAPQDPWSWANLPEVRTGGTVAATPIEWGLNPAYGITSGMTNRDALNAISGVLTPQERAIFSAQFTANPASATGTNWTTAGSPGALINRSSDAALSPEFLDARAKVANNIYTQTGGGTGGVSVPTGYANPVPQG